MSAAVPHSEEFVARLRALWQAGLPTAEIGKQLGVSKNVVVSLAHRKGFPPRRNPTKPKVEAAPAVGVRSERGCRFPLWPHGEKPTGEFCGAAPSEPGSPYCAHHHARCYVGKPVREGSAPYVAWSER